MLLKAGLSVNVQNKVECQLISVQLNAVWINCPWFLQGGWTPFMVAIWHGQSTVAEVLQRSSADIDAVNQSGVSALTLAVIKSPSLVRLCVTNNCQLNVQEKTVSYINPANQCCPLNSCSSRSIPGRPFTLPLCPIALIPFWPW